jgi:rhodanese-related sulfurtransferase
MSRVRVEARSESTAPLGARVAGGDLAARLDSVTVLDVRSPAEFDSVHIPGSVNLPLDRLPEYVSELTSAVRTPVVLICRSGQRAREAERALEAAGLPGLHVLDGGLTAWESAGLPVVRGKQRWSMERQVRGTAGALVLASLAASLVLPPLAWVAAGIGGGLLFSAIADTCAMAKILARLPYNHGARCDASLVLRSIEAARQRRDQRTTGSGGLDESNEEGEI